MSPSLCLWRIGLGRREFQKIWTTWCNFVEKRTISNTHTHQSIRDLLLSTPPTTPPPLHHRTTATTKSIQEQESSAETPGKPVYCGGLLRLKNKTLNISSMVQIVLCLKNTPQHFSIPFLLSLFVVTTVCLSSLCKGSKVKTREVSWKSKWKLFFSLLKSYHPFPDYWGIYTLLRITAIGMDLVISWI